MAAGPAARATTGLQKRTCTLGAGRGRDRVPAGSGEGEAERRREGEDPPEPEPRHPRGRRGESAGETTSRAGPAILPAVDIRIDSALEGTLALAVVFAEGVRVHPAGPDLWAEIEALSGRCRERFGGAGPSGIPELAPARELYRACGIDPTKRRPSSEALLRRVLQGKPLYRISNAVDACNFCSLRFLLPIGLYDADRVAGGAAVVRRGLPGESYPGIGKDVVTLGGQILLADAAGPFGNPSSDSFRTRVTESCSSLLWVIFAPAGTDPKVLRAHAEASRDWIEKACGGAARVR
jgi:DNA/RNA-binding domain of Phe-tRNA-synthetase-like protein